jgi:hypothetical protein
MFGVTTIDVWDMLLPLSAELRRLGLRRSTTRKISIRSCLAQSMQCPGSPNLDHIEQSRVTGDSMNSDSGKEIQCRLHLVESRESQVSTT